MKRDAQTQMLFAATKHVLDLGGIGELHRQEWLDHWKCFETNCTLFWAAGAKQKHRAVIAVVDVGSPAAVRACMMDYRSMARIGNQSVYLYEDGHDILADTGALAALRGK